MTTLRLLDPNGYLVPGTVTTVSPGAETEVRAQLAETAAGHAAQWADHGYDPRRYRIVTDRPAA